MPKYFGKIGFAPQYIETSPGVVVEEIIERDYFGDILTNIRRLQNGESVNDNINISNVIEIVSDPYAVENFHSIRYVTYMNTKWKVTSVEVIFPRLKLTLGGIYNE